MRQQSEHISPFEGRFTANCQSVDTKRKSHRTTAPFLLDLKINRNQKHTWQSPAIRTQLIHAVTPDLLMNDLFLLKLPCHEVQVGFKTIYN